jgi:hypothetical protein
MTQVRNGHDWRGEKESHRAKGKSNDAQRNATLHLHYYATTPPNQR